MNAFKVVSLSALLLAVSGAKLPLDQRAVASSNQRSPLEVNPYANIQVVSANPYVLNVDDGSYAFGYQQDDGAYTYAQGSGAAAAGGFGYKNEFGEGVDTQWEAGVQGYIPTGAHLKGLVIPEVSATPWEAAKEDPFYTEESDATFAFGYNGDESAREEVSDSEGNVQGSYSYIDADGNTKTLRYKAGAGIGFVPEAEFIPYDPAVAAARAAHFEAKRKIEQELGLATAKAANAQKNSYNEQKTTTTFNRQSNFQTGNQVFYNPLFGAASTQSASVVAAPALPVTGYPQAAATSPVKFYAPKESKPSQLYGLPEVSAAGSSFKYQIDQPISVAAKKSQIQVQPVRKIEQEPEWIPNEDASYNFAYSAEASARAEESDVDGNVRGEYTYTNEEGNTITVRYVAGADIGFVIENADELAAFVEKATVEGAEAYANKPKPYYAEEESDITFKQSTVNMDDWTLNHDHAFGYSSSQGSRQEIGQGPDGSVVGSYSLIGADGQQFEVRYRAGPEIGFVIENMEEVLAKSVPKDDEAVNAAVGVVAYEKNAAKATGAAGFAGAAASGNNRYTQANKKATTATSSGANGFAGSNRFQATNQKTGFGQNSAANRYSASGSLTANTKKTTGFSGLAGSSAGFTGASTGFNSGSLGVTGASSGLAGNNNRFSQSGASSGLAGNRFQATNQRTGFGQASTSFGQNSAANRYSASGSLTANTKKTTGFSGLAGSSAGFTGASTGFNSGSVGVTGASSGLAGNNNRFTQTKKTTTTVTQNQTPAIAFGQNKYTNSFASNSGDTSRFAAAAQGNRKTFGTAEEKKTTINRYAAANTKTVEPTNRIQPAAPTTQYTARPVSAAFSTTQTFGNKATTAAVRPAFNKAVTTSSFSSSSSQSNRPSTTGFNKQTNIASVRKTNTGLNSDKTYKFGFASSEESSARQEESDAEGNVRGQYSYINAEGNEIIVKYSATKEGGFVIENQAELSRTVEKATLDAAVAAAAARSEVSAFEQQQMSFGSNAGFKGFQLPSFQQRQEIQTSQKQEQISSFNNGPAFAVPASNAQTATVRRRKIVKKIRPSFEQKTFNQRVTSGAYDQSQFDNNLFDADLGNSGDASFSYSYSGQDLRQEERSDASGERIGSYSYLDPEGTEITVRYKAGKNGFEILNKEDVLPGY